MLKLQKSQLGHFLQASQEGIAHLPLLQNRNISKVYDAFC